MKVPPTPTLPVEERVLGGVRGFCSENKHSSNLFYSQYGRFPV
jgi:hypothetical protein